MLPSTRTANTTTFFVNICVFFGELMAAFAMCFFSHKLPTHTNNVFGAINLSCYHSQVIDVAASMITALMVDYQAIRNWTICQLPHITMNLDGSSVETNSPISFFIFSASPFVARTNQSWHKTWRFAVLDSWWLILYSFSRIKRIKRLSFSQLNAMSCTKAFSIMWFIASIECASFFGRMISRHNSLRKSGFRLERPRS